ncbi:hypothetical protein [Blastococcus montanus]|uniref:Rv0361 family membrane protein n=1 Tax=Blastococcus montanus TaxID=3144973 RepID=UPI003207C8D5
MSGPFLYDEDPAPLHTGTPRARKGWLIGGLVGVPLVAVGMVAALYLVQGSPEEQATQVTGVFLAALAAGDSETAYQLLCEDERARLDVDGLDEEYLRPGAAEVIGVEDDATEGARIQEVTVRWEDGATAQLEVVREDGPRICGID